MRLVSLDAAKRYARITAAGADVDAEVDLFIQAASQAVVSHILSGSAYLDFLDSDGEALQEDSEGVTQDVPPVVQSAALFMVAWLNDHRGEDDAKLLEGGYLPFPVRALLGPLRDPVMA